MVTQFLVSGYDHKIHLDLLEKLKKYTWGDRNYKHYKCVVRFL